MKTSSVPAHRLREIAVRSRTDPRTVQRYFDRRAVSPLCLERILRALLEMNIEVMP